MCPTCFQAQDLGFDNYASPYKVHTIVDRKDWEKVEEMSPPEIRSRSSQISTLQHYLPGETQ